MPASELDRAVFEYEDNRLGDYTTERERIRAVWESQAVHHRGRRRSLRRHWMRKYRDDEAFARAVLAAAYLDDLDAAA